jgi:hypothetical protein
MYRAMRIVSVIALLAVVLQFGTSAQARPDPAGQPDASKNGLVVSITNSPDQQKAALDFWTRQAIADARPMAMPSQAGPAVVDKAALAKQDAVVGQFGFAPAGAPAPDADQKAQAAYPSDWEMIRAGSSTNALSANQPDGTSQTYTSYTVNQWSPAQTIYPHVWIGRLSFATSGGTAYCSGTAISGNVMLTAAHCVYDTTNNKWYSNWAFTPAYRNGSAPYGVFVATSCTVLTAWINLSGNYAINTWAPYDVAVCKMGKNSAGQTLNQAVGYMGREWNFPYVRHFHVFGYPFNDTNNNVLPDAGLYLRTCVGESFQQATEVRGIGCNYGPGISGGPWMAGYALSLGTGAVSGVNSGMFTGTQNMYAGRFNSNNIVPLCTAVGC